MDKPLNEFYDEVVRRCEPDDFWGQVMRSMGGNRFPEERVEMIVSAIIEGLDLREDDYLLDLCCGNGALSTRVFARCRGGYGVDFSGELIRVARENFEDSPRETYQLGDVVEYLGLEPRPERFTKVVCYGSFQCLAQDDARRFLADINRRFVGVSRIFLGNMPDLDRLDDYPAGKRHSKGCEREHNSMFGVWRTKDEIVELAREAGWSAEVSTMPSSFPAATFRFDAVLTRSR
ncbi:MAG: class I SAM-dependent methyltransferase [Pseudodesulfovibrio sp.]|uniref:class I SAM-dependent methyltransferase n=1 Tax=Pseudodesulfovibrio sp. TaxID=2035812 RepID=UPI003D0F82C2